MSQSPPTTLGKYQILREIARSNDIVYEAYDAVMNRRVAVKELAMPSGATDLQKEDRIKRFLREARAAGSLVHPNIVTIYEVGEDAGRRYIAMEYLDGQNLRNLLDTKGFIEPKRAIEIAIEVLRGLDFAHSHGVIHRDIKPDNIQLLESGEVKLTDFGIARLTFEPNLTMDGQVFGTPSYMSPEQINGRDIDARSDLFSVGVILYEMIAGQKPFTGDNVVAITYAIMNADPDQPNQCGPSLWHVIRQSIDKSPQLRWGSAKEMIAALQRVLDEIVSGHTVQDPQLLQTGGYLPTNYSPGPPPVQTGYTPYGTPLQGTMQPAMAPPQAYAPPTQLPYGQPNMQPYGQPYSPQTPQTYQPPVGQGQLPFIPIPVYYPPAPRGPMFSPETRSFFGKLAMWLLIAGTLAALMVMAIFKGAEAINKPGMPHLPPSKGTSSPPSNATKPETRPATNTGTPAGDTVVDADAETAVQRAIQEPRAEARRQRWSEAASLWSRVILQNDTIDTHRNAVASYLYAAKGLYESGDTQRAAEAVYEAQGFAQGYPELSEKVEEWRIALNR